MEIKSKPNRFKKSASDITLFDIIPILRFLYRKVSLDASLKTSEEVKKITVNKIVDCVNCIIALGLLSIAIGAFTSFNNILTSAFKPLIIIGVILGVIVCVVLYLSDNGFTL